MKTFISSPIICGLAVFTFNITGSPLSLTQVVILSVAIATASCIGEYL